MSRQPRELVTIDRAFGIFIYPSMHDGERDCWYAHIVGPNNLDQLTFAQDPVCAVEMALDVLRLMTRTCTVDGEGGRIDHNYTVDSALSDGTPAWGCSRCDVRTAKTEFPDES